MRPVPMLSFMVRHYKCQAGICITASHNPAPYNGYKVYWNGGGQLIPPHDKHIWDFYKEISDYSKIPFLAFAQACQRGLVSEIGDELDQSYFAKLKLLSLFEGNRDLKIVYSPLHGTGIFAVPKGLEQFGFHDVSIVQEQSQPDGNFPTVASPNPEEYSSLAMALELGSSIKADIILATDPDSDRLAVVIRENAVWQNFSGNQMGALLFEYLLSRLKAKNKLPADGFTIKTIVTSELLRDISNSYGLPCEETLTGFKWICDLVERYESGQLSPAKKFLCGAEESYGFLAGTFVRDKDAILSSVIATEMVAYYRSLNRTLSEVLDELFMRHGFYYELLETITLPGKDGDERIQFLMKSLRQSPPIQIGVHPVEFAKDYLELQMTKRVGSQFVRHAAIDLPKSDVLQYLCHGVHLTIRPSGTEPKIKVYLSTVASTKSLAKNDLPRFKQVAAEQAKALMKNFLSLLAAF